MADLVRVDIRSRKRKGALKSLECRKHALRRLARCIEVCDRRTVCGDLFRALVTEEAAPSELASSGRKARASLREFAALRGRAGGHRADTEQRRNDRQGLCPGEL